MQSAASDGASPSGRSSSSGGLGVSDALFEEILAEMRLRPGAQLEQPLSAASLQDAASQATQRQASAHLQGQPEMDLPSAAPPSAAADLLSTTLSGPQASFSTAATRADIRQDSEDLQQQSAPLSGASQLLQETFASQAPSLGLPVSQASSSLCTLDSGITYEMQTGQVTDTHGSIHHAAFDMTWHGPHPC